MNTTVPSLQHLAEPSDGTTEPFQTSPCSPVGGRSENHRTAGLEGTKSPPSLTPCHRLPPPAQAAQGTHSSFRSPATSIPSTTKCHDLKIRLHTSLHYNINRAVSIRLGSASLSIMFTVHVNAF